ncbi:hypothetical protein RQP46_007517 [Phenoliferia psychrophenolica]
MSTRTPRASTSGQGRGTPQSTNANANGKGAAQRPAYVTPRAVTREKWNRAFNGAAYLDGGVSNRLTLALLSPIDSEADWALDRLIQVSGQDPDLLRFSDFPGLLSALLARIRTFLDSRDLERASSSPSWPSPGLWIDERRTTTTRRATEAALVLRNLATEAVNTPALLAARKLTRLIVDVLSEGHHESITLGEGAETTTELRLYLLEVLEVVASDCVLLLPGRPLSSEPGSKPAPSSSPSVRLFPLLVALTRSPDRALVIAAFRSLVALALNDSSDPALALMTYPPVDPSLNPHPHPIQTSIELLPVADSELATAMLDFMYQHTLVDANAVAFCARPELVHVLRLVSSRLHVMAGKETVQMVIPVKGTDAEAQWKALPQRHPRKKRPGEGKDPNPKMSKLELEKLLRLPDSEARGLNWMRQAFESFPNGEVTQVALWTAYRTEFEPHAITHPMLAAADVIKMSTEAFPAALPMVTEGPDKRFIIKGIRIRDRTDTRLVFRCRWLGCPTPLGPTSPEQLYWHVHHQHLAASPTTPPPQCRWFYGRAPTTSVELYCPYVPSPSSLASPHLHLSDLSLHVRTHMPLYHAPTGYGSPPTLPPTPPPPDQPSYVTSSRYHAQVDDSGACSGLAFLACLVLRNVARTIKLALGNPAGGASVNSLSGGEESIFEAFTKAAEGSVGRDEVLMRLEKVEFGEAKSGARALLLRGILRW